MDGAKDPDVIKTTEDTGSESLKYSATRSGNQISHALPKVISKYAVSGCSLIKLITQLTAGRDAFENQQKLKGFCRSFPV